MPDLGKLRWVMDVDTTRFDGKLRSVRAAISSVGAGLAALGVSRRVADTYGRAETLIQAGKTTGIGVEALQELEAAAGQSGMAPGEILSSLTEFSRAVAQLQGGRGPLKRVPGRARGVLGDVMAAQRTGGTEAALSALSAGVARLEPGLGGTLAEKAGFRTPQAYELLAGGPQVLAETRAQYRKTATPMTQQQAEIMKAQGDQIEAMQRRIAELERQGYAGVAGAFDWAFGPRPGGAEVDRLRGVLRDRIPTFAPFASADTQATVPQPPALARSEIDRLVQALSANTQATDRNTRTAGTAAAYQSPQDQERMGARIGP